DHRDPVLGELELAGRLIELLQSVVERRRLPILQRPGDLLPARDSPEVDRFLVPLHGSRPRGRRVGLAPAGAILEGADSTAKGEEGRSGQAVRSAKPPDQK